MKCRIVLKSFSKSLLLLTEDQIKNIFLKLNINFKHIKLPNKIKRFCILRSPHGDKDSREHFKLIIYKSFYDITLLSPIILNNLLKQYISSGILCKFIFKI